MGILSLFEWCESAFNAHTCPEVDLLSILKPAASRFRCQWITCFCGVQSAGSVDLLARRDLERVLAVAAFEGILVQAWLVEVRSALELNLDSVCFRRLRLDMLRGLPCPARLEVLEMRRDGVRLRSV